jgi:predicted extracellular nuclease
VRRRTASSLSTVALLAITSATGLTAFATTAAEAADPDPAGNVFVSRLGDGSGTLTSAATPVFVDEYTPSGTLVRSIPLPTAVSGANQPLTMSGSAGSEGALELSADGRFVTLAGYAAAVGTSSVVGTSVPRVVGRVDSSGAVNTSTALTDAYGGNNIRGAVSDDGSRFWIAGAAGGLRLAQLGATTSTSITTTPSNVRVPVIGGGQLYVSTGSGTTGVYSVGTGLPATSGQTSTAQLATPSPYASVFLDRDPAVPGVDTAYVADDSGTGSGGGLVKFSSNGTSWTKVGTYTGSNSLTGLTGAVQGSTAKLWAVTKAGSLVPLTDTAASSAAPAVTAGSTISPGTNKAFRGVAFAPTASTPAAPSITAQPQSTTVDSGQTATLSVTATGSALSYQWYQGAVGDTSAPVGTNAATFTTPALTATTTYWVRVTGAGGTTDSAAAVVTVQTTVPNNTAPTISTADPIALTVGDVDNPPANRTVTVGDAETPGALSVTVTSDNPAVATGSVTGTGTARTFVPVAVAKGRATLTLTVSDGDLTASSTTLVSVGAAVPGGFHSHYGASDASTAVDLGGGAMVVADDENNTLRVYDRDHSRYPTQTIDLRAAGLALPDGDPTREIDIEASARVGNTIYWVGSQGQNKDNKTRLNRQVLFTTTVSGTGPTATLTVGGSYQKLRTDLVAWDVANGNALGLAAAANRAPEGDGGSGPGFNIEGAEFSADGSTLYVAFRGPLTSDGKAIIVPVTNPAALVAGNPTTGVTATFGTPITWDLGGRGIRELRRNATGQYLVIAGPPGAGTGAAGEFRLYSWNGSATSAPVLRPASLDQLAAFGKPEAIVSVPSPLTDSSTIQLLGDSGDTDFYGDGSAAKDLPLDQRKALSATLAVGALPACSTDAVSIGSVQGVTDTSPVTGQTVTVRGKVVADDEGAQPALRGFYVQDAGDGDPATSDGIFVFDNGADLVANGDVVTVTGPVSEFQGQTQITATATGIATCAGVTLDVAPTDVTLPRASANDLEPLEGMLVRFHQQLVVTEHFQLGRFGQVVLSSGGRLQQPTNVISSADAAAVAALQAQNNLNRIILDDNSQIQNPDPIAFGRGGQPLSASNTLRGGDTVTDPVGVLTYTWAGNAASGNAFRLRPLEALGGTAVFDPANPRPTTAPNVGTGGVKVASANLLNFFNTFSGCTFGVGGAAADCRGANNAAEYQRQLDKEVASLRFSGADVIGIMEMENDGYGSSSAVQALVDALNAVDGPGAWAFVNPDVAGGTNAAGTDAIKAGVLYRTASVSPVGPALTDDLPLFERHPVAQTFQTPAGARFTVVANHFKSKGSCPTSGPDTDQGDGQSCWNARRTDQATELVRWVNATVVPAAGDPDVLLLGDFNSYAKEDPIRVLEAAGFVNQIPRFDGPDAYSYVFDGQWGSLDHVFASASLDPRMTGAGDLHQNADEPSVLDYNTEFKSAGQVASLYAPDRFRTSDHDPVLVAFDPGNPGPAASSTTLTVGTVTPNAPVTLTATVSGPSAPTGTVTFKNAGTAFGTAPITDGKATLTTSAPPGTYQVTATYGGNAQLLESTSGAVTVVVPKRTTSVVLSTTPSPAKLGQAVSVTAVVGPDRPAGSVQVSLDGGAPSTLALKNGAITVSSSSLPAGRHVVRVDFPGNATLEPSTASINVDVAYVVTLLAPSAPKAGQPITFQVTLANAAGTRIPDVEAASIGCRLTIAVSGAQALAPTCLTYDPTNDVFTFTTPTGSAKGAIDITAALSYPGVSVTQTVTVRRTLT